MRKVVLFIAMSIDGYIADLHGGIEWLEGQESGANDMESYETFAQNVDTVIMGANTYHQIVTELSPDEWVYSDFTSYVVTHTPKGSTDKIRFTEEDPCQLVTRLKQETGKNIWICGGASVVKQLMKADLIEQYYINVIPSAFRTNGRRNTSSSARNCGNGSDDMDSVNKTLYIPLYGNLS